jgi:hypothetical protein
MGLWPAGDFRPLAVRNNLALNTANGSRSAQFTPGQPQRIDSHGSDLLRCLLWGKLGIMGAWLKPGNNLLGPAAVGIRCGSQHV